MIKINLLPVKAAKRREQGQRQLLVGGIVLLSALTGIVVFNHAQAATVDELRDQNQRISSDIARPTKRGG